jgi:hypothetical protein
MIGAMRLMPVIVSKLPPGRNEAADGRQTLFQ